MTLTLTLQDTFRGQEILSSIRVSIDQILQHKNPEFLKTLVLKLQRDLEKEMQSKELYTHKP
jgi:hypothetical protein